MSKESILKNLIESQNTTQQPKKEDSALPQNLLAEKLKNILEAKTLDQTFRNVL